MPSSGSWDSARAGRTSPDGQKVSGSPRFQVGQEVIVLLQRHPALDWLMPVGLAQGRYVITGFNPDDDQQISTSASVWRIQLGVRYEF